MRFLALLLSSFALSLTPSVGAAAYSEDLWSKDKWDVTGYYAYARIHLDKTGKESQLIGVAQISLANRLEASSFDSADFMINPGYKIDSVKVGNKKLLFDTEVVEIGDDGDLLANLIKVNLGKSYGHQAQVTVEIAFSGTPEQLTDSEAGIAPTPAEALAYEGFDFGHDGLTLPIFAGYMKKVEHLLGYGQGYARIVDVEVPTTHQVIKSDHYKVRGPTVKGDYRQYKAVDAALENLIAVQIRLIK